MSTELTTASSAVAATTTQYSYPPAPPYFPLPFHLQITTPPIKIPAVPPSLALTLAPVYPTVAPVVTTAGVYSLPQYQQAWQLFQKDAQTITPEALESVKAALESREVDHKLETKKKAIPCKAAGQTWEDPTLADWPENDFQLFCGDLGNEVNDDVLSKAFSRFPSFNMARSTYPNLGISGCLPYASKYVGNRPIKLRKSTWKERTDYEALEKQKNLPQKKPKLPKKGILHK